ncbi:MAG: hypothetical protein ABIW46_08590 [Acidimicrobiales bacterium]
MKTLVLAHGSGVDEIISLLVPLVIVGGLWLWSRRRRVDDDDRSEPDGP